MPSFTEWEARRRGAVPAAAPAVNPDVEYDANYQPDPNNERLSFTQDPSRYMGHALKGLVRSPVDLVKGFLGIPGQVVKGLTQDVPALLNDPSLLMEAPGAIKEGAQYANTHPEEMGSFLGQSLLAPKVPGAANAALAKGPGIVGRGMGAVGRGMETVGTSKALKSANKYGVMGTAMSGHPGIAALELAAPPALEYGGRAMQRGGAALEGLDLAYKGKTPFAREAGPEPVDPAAVMREKVAGARGDVEAGFSRPVAGKLNGLKSTATDVSHPSAEVVSPGELFPYQRDSIRGLREAAQPPMENAWANDASAQRPIDKFYESDPAARVGGEGRMTGQFDEGAGGLTDISAGNFTRNPSPAEAATLAGLDSRISGLAPEGPLDELSRLSGRQASPTRMQELLDRLGGRGAAR